MMERRLILAKELIKPDGVIVIAIDDYEFGHLSTLLESSKLFRRWSQSVAVVQHSRKGGGGDTVSRSHEYAVFLVPPGGKLHPIQRGTDERRDFRRRGRDPRNLRVGRPRSFFAIHVDPETLEAVDIGPELQVEEAYETGSTPEGLLRVYPLGRENLERVWRNSRNTTLEKIAARKLRCTPRGTIYELISGEDKQVPVLSVWTGSRYNAGQHGTNLVRALAGNEFPYPKSLYTVADCLAAALGSRRDALVLDFFGGSGTTLHAVAMMNEVDGGSRQCVLVTNNEASAEDERRLLERGLFPGDDRWEAEGICRSVTWPRCRSAVLGVAPDGTALLPNLAYQTGVEETIEGEPEVLPISFTAATLLQSRGARSELAALLGLPRRTLDGGTGWYVPPVAENGTAKSDIAVLLDPEDGDAFVAALAEGGDHVSRVRFVPPTNSRQAQALRAEIVAALPPTFAVQERVVPMSLGLKANLDYLRLEFLDPLDVERGQSVAELIPALWAMAGGVGSIPAMSGEESWLVPEDGRWAFLIKTRSFRSFVAKLADRSDVEWVFIISASEDGFAEMSSLLPVHIPQQQRVHLYRRYLENFMINGATA